MARISIIAAALIAIAASAARAQQQVMVPLADVARQAEAAKATARKAKKTYTNASLTAELRDQPAAASAAAAPRDAVAITPGGKPEPAPAAPTAGNAKAEGGLEEESEEAWRARAASLRTQADRLRARMTGLTIPNRLKDENPLLKAANDIEIANTRTAIDGLKKQWARLEASASELKIPLAWIQPAPVFPQ